jgi:Protein of unknown function (DUF2500)
MGGCIVFNSDPFDSGGFQLFNIMQFIIPIVFIVVFGFILFNIIKGVKQWNYNNKQPVLSVYAKVVSKRTKVSHHNHNHNGNHSHSSSTYYYATFEVESGDRMELAVKGQEFGLIAEGDFGKLTFQGTRYLGFDRSS